MSRGRWQRITETRNSPGHNRINNQNKRSEMITIANQDFAGMNVSGVLIWRGCNDEQVCVQSVLGVWGARN